MNAIIRRLRRKPLPELRIWSRYQMGSVHHRAVVWFTHKDGKIEYRAACSYLTGEMGYTPPAWRKPCEACERRRQP